METLRLFIERHDLVLGIVPALLLMAGGCFSLWPMMTPRYGAYEDRSGLVFSAFPYNSLFPFFYIPFGLVEFLKHLSEGWATRHFDWMMWLDLSIVLMMFVAAAFSLPGTIVLGPDGIYQRFWLLKDRCIRYCDVNKIVSQQAGVTVKPHVGRAISFVNAQGFPDRALFEETITHRVGQPTVGTRSTGWLRR
ncbi:hypothetical protein SAMN05421770_101304 [Granulicella rosea]|uniref:Uncharacterized protein n=1 Tax=Granulicella rosea TaxID=474952 RepID=A0A239D550_9BACT|nr:hypothetical protein [Granulicella rosea]SNS27646.1 hypothetical protein SAMN05421770_101304 [Granulicella rosea]